MNVEKCFGDNCASDHDIEEFIISHQIAMLLNQGSYSPEDYSKDYVKRFSSVKPIPLTIERPSPCSTMTITQNRVDSNDNFVTSLLGSSTTFLTVEDYLKLPINFDDSISATTIYK